MPKTTLAQRVQAALDAAGVKQAWLETDAKLPKGYVSRILNGERKKLGADMLERIATSLKVDYLWLSTGNGPGPKVIQASESAAMDDGEGRWFSDEVEALALRLARQKGAPEYTYPEMKAAKIFLSRAATMLTRGSNRFDLLASAAEAARKLSAAGQTPTADLIFELLILKNKPAYVPKEEESELDKLLRQGEQEAERAGAVATRTPVDATPRARAAGK